MSRSIDERVVSMEFDNSNFEKNVKTSLSTLDRLKEALHLSGASKGLEDFGNSIEQTGHKFSALEVIATGALLKIGSQAVSAGERLLKSISVDQVAAGWQKFADKTTSVATLVAQGNAIEDVNAELNKLNWFTDETSYNFTEMVANIAKFTATGKGLSESMTAMEGIATWAALSGQNANTATRAMFQLSQAMGSGYMRLEDYKSIQNASMDTDEFRQKTIEAAIELGTLKQIGADTYQSLVANADAFTKSQFAKSLTEGEWFTSDVMMKVFTEYASAVESIYQVTEETGRLASDVIDEIHQKSKEFTAQGLIEEEAIDEAIIALGYVDEAGNALFDHFGLKAFEAGQKARTLKDAIDSVKDAVSTGWMTTFEHIFGNAEEATEIWTRLANSMYDVFAEGGNRRNEWLKGAFTSSWSSLTEQIQDCGIEVDAFEKAVSEAAKNSGIDIESLVKKYGSLEKTFQSGDISANNASSIMKKAFASLTGEIDISTKSLEDYQKLVDEIWRGDWGNVEERFKALRDAGYDDKAIQSLVNKGRDYKLTLEDLSEAQLKTIGLTDDQITKLDELKKQAEETGTPLEELINNITKPSGRTLLIETFANVLGSIGKIMISVREAFQNVFLNSDGLYNAIAWWNELTGKVAEFINLITEADEDTGLSKLTKSFQGLFAAIDIVLITIKDVAKGIISFVRSVLDVFGFKDLSLSLIDFTANLGDSIVAFRDQVREVGLLKAAFGDFADYLSTIASGIKKAFLELIGKFKALDSFSFSNILTILTEFKDKVKEVFSTNSENKYAKSIVSICTKISNALKKVWSWIKNIAAQIYAVPIVNKYLSSIITWIQNVHKSATTYFKSVIAAVQEMIAELKNLDEVNLDSIFAIFDNFKKKIKNIFSIGNETKEIGNNIALGLASGLKNGIKTIIKVATDFATIIVNTVKKLLGINSPSTVFMAIGGFIIAGLMIGLTQGFEPLQEKLGEIVNAIINIFSKVDWNKVFVVGTILSFIYIANKLVGSINTVCKSMDGIVKTVQSIVNPISTITDSFKGFINNLSTQVTNISNAIIKNIKARTFENTAKSITMIAGAITTLVLAVAGLAFLNQSGLNVWEAMAQLGVIAAGLLAFAAVAQFIKPTDFGKVSIMLLALSGVIAVLYMVLKKLSEFNTALGSDNLIPVIASTIEVVALMAVLAFVLAKLGKFASGKEFTNIGKAGLLLIGMSTALLMVSHVLKVIADIPSGAVSKGIFFIGTVIVLFTMFSLLGSLTTMFGNQANKTGKMLIKMSAAILLLTYVVKMMAKVSTDDLGKAILFIGSIEILFAAFSIFGSGLAKKGAFSNEAGSMLLKMSAAILILVFVVKLLASASSDDIGKCFAFVAGIETLFILLVGISRLAGQYGDKAGSMLMKAAIGIGILVLVVKLLASSTQEDINKALHFISSIEILFGALIAVSYLAGQNADKAGNMLMKMTVPILILIAAVALLGFLTDEEVKRGTECVTALMGMMALIIASTYKVDDKILAKLMVIPVIIGLLAGCVYLLSKYTDTDKAIAATGEIAILMLSMAVAIKILNKVNGMNKSMLKTLGVMTLVVVGLGVVVGALSLLKVEGSIKTAASISLLLLAMSAACRILNNIKIDNSILGTLGVMTGVVVGIGLVLGLMDGFKVEGSIKTAVSISLLLLAMSAACRILNNVKIDKSVMGTLAIMGLVVAGLGVILGVVIDLIPGATDFITGGFDILIAFVKKIGELVGVLITGIGVGVTSGLPEMAEYIGTAITTINEAAKFVDPETATTLQTFGDGIGAFVKAALDSTVVNLLGGSGFNTLTENLPKLGKALKDFSDSVKGDNMIDKDAVKNAAEAGEYLAKMINTLPSSDGLMQTILGSKDLASFTENLPNFATALRLFSIHLGSGEYGTNFEAIKSASEAGTALANMINTLPSSDGWMQTILGSKDLDTFSLSLPKFASALRIFSINLGKGEYGTDIDAIMKASEAGAALTRMVDNLPSSDGWMSTIIGTKDLATFSNNLGTFGRALRSFSASTKDVIDEGTVTAAENSGKAIKALNDNLPSTDSLWDKISGNEKVSISAIGEELKTFGEQITSLDTEKLSKGCNAIKNILEQLSSTDNYSGDGFTKIVESLKTLSETSAENIAISFENAIPRMTIAASNMFIAFNNTATVKMSELLTYINNTITNIYTLIISKASYFTVAGQFLMLRFMLGINSKTQEVLSKITTIIDDCVTAINGGYQSFYDAGVALVDGFASGITAETFAAEAAAKAMAEAAEAAAKKALDINSPSKVFRNMAYSVPEGFAQGIDKMQGLVENSSVRMAQSAIDSAKSAISRLGRVVNSDIDSKPTIRPVVDLDALDTRTIQLGANIDASIGGPIHSLSNIIADYQDGIAASNNEVINAVNGLRSDLNAMYNNDDQEVALYVDSKKLASTLAKPMNRQLNILSKRGAY